MSNRAIRYRIYPNKDQEVLISKTFGCCRKVWNLMLSERRNAYKSEGKTVKPTPAKYKTDFPYLREVDSLALANVQLDLEKAYQQFFYVKGTGYPKFKSKKRCRNSYTTNNQNRTVAMDVPTSTIRLPKVGFIKAVFHRLPPNDWNLKSATISMTPSGKYYCSMLFEMEDPVPAQSIDLANSIGMDYKTDGLYVASDGSSPGSPKYYRKAQKALAHEQRGLRHKVKGSRNYEKQKLRIARKYEKIANQRFDFLHKESAAIAKRYDLVAVESLNMKSMSNKAFGNGKATMDNGWGLFVRMMEYKLKDHGKSLMFVDKWFPSSQACSACGYINKAVKDLCVRKWTCPCCGKVHDRDINAAINIREEGIRMFETILAT